MSRPSTVKPILTRLRNLSLLAHLAREAGWRHVLRLALFTFLSSLLEIGSLGLGVSLLLKSSPSFAARLPFHLELPLPQALLTLLGLMLVRGGLQALITIGLEDLRCTFGDQLRQGLLSQVLHAPSPNLQQLGRGDLIGLLMADISSSVLALEQGTRVLQSLLSLLLLAGGVLAVGRWAAAPLLLALVATGVAALLQRSGSWKLGRLRTRLNAALQRTVGDGLHGVKAVRAAGGETWLLRRFSLEALRYRQVLFQIVRRQAAFNALRDTLVVLVVGVWLIWGRGDLPATAVATTLLFAYRSGTVLSAAIGAQRHCLGALPGYAALCERRSRLTPPPVPAPSRTTSPERLGSLRDSSVWRGLSWHGTDGMAGLFEDSATLHLRPGSLMVVVGPSGTGKTTLLDRFCGLLGEERSAWQLQTRHGDILLAGPAGAGQLRQVLAYAPQVAVLFEASLRNNLTLDQRQGRGVIEPWLERLGLSHLLQRGEGLDGTLPLMMDHFSGGEIHRLCLLRAWLRDRPVEVLDEPTAYLDTEAAEGVCKILKERSRQRLVLVSSHDPALIAMADGVLRLTSAERHEAERQHQVGG